MAEPEQMDLDSLDHACQQESGRFFHNQVTDERFCYEIFRRAIELKNIHAWTVVWKNYQRLVYSWVRTAGGSQLGIPTEELVTLSFEKFWYAFQGHLTIQQFPSLAALLQYLRRCCNSAVMDSLRRHKSNRALDNIDDVPLPSSAQKLDQFVVELQAKQQFWGLVRSLLNGPQEELVIYSYFVMGFKPRQIQKEYPDTFPSVTDVYRIKRKVMSRLRHVEALRDIWRDQ